MKRTAWIVVGAALLLASGWQVRVVTQAGAKALDPAADTAAPAPRIRAEGRLVTYPGGEVVVRAEVGGRITRITVDEGAEIVAGQRLAEFDADEDLAALAEARARLAEADAALELAEIDAARDDRLLRAEVVSERSAERSSHARDVARARRDLARASVQRLDARLAKSRIDAPIGGVVIARTAEPGGTAMPGDALLTLADLQRVRIEAEVNEFDAARLRVGAAVRVVGEGYERSWRGRVEEIPDAVTARRLRPQDPSRPADTRVLLVKVALEETVPLRLGQRVEVEIEGGV